MGGARCSYRNCTKKSDKKTHFFHYPVFDKIRCHQWITNAQKLDYLNLKLSQLKNRMVCEHHFTDDCFMNEMKRKLKNSAIPTEDGPFCAKPSWDEENEAQGKKEIEMPINLDDIENEFTPFTEKKSHYSVKYGDFLTNDITDGINLTPNYKKSSAKIQDHGIILNRYDGQPQLSYYNQMPRKANRNFEVTRMIRANQAKCKEIVKSHQLPSATVVPIDFDEFNLVAHGQNEAKPSASISSAQEPTEQVTNIKAALAKPKTNKVQIISEKHISEPVIIPGELQLVSPSIVIQVPDKRKKCNIEVDGQEIKTLYIDDTQKFQHMKNEQDFNTMTYVHKPGLPELEQSDELYQPGINEPMNNLAIQNEPHRADANFMDCIPSGANYGTHMEQASGLSNTDTSTPNVEFVSSSLMGPSVFTLTEIPQVSTSVSEPYINNNLSLATQNALSTIDKEIINANQEQSSVPVTRSLLKASKNTSPNKSTRHKMPPEKLAAIEEKRKYNMKLKDILNSCLNNMDEEPDLRKLTAAMKKEASSKKVGEHLYENNSEVSKQQNSQENIIAYFEARLQRMENNLLNKIEQNSQKITDLKKIVKNPVKKSTFTQTYFGSEVTKKNLYREISQYLSPSANSLIYEELFINQCLLKTEPKKRKRKYNNSDKEL